VLAEASRSRKNPLRCKHVCYSFIKPLKPLEAVGSRVYRTKTRTISRRTPAVPNGWWSARRRFSFVLAAPEIPKTFNHSAPKHPLEPGFAFMGSKPREASDDISSCLLAKSAILLRGQLIDQLLRLSAEFPLCFESTIRPRFHGVDRVYPQSKEIEQATCLVASHGVEPARFIVEYGVSQGCVHGRSTTGFR
jgi:hypothetical protein